jgi:peptidoglycan/LPS O-acetylase OafA/YrhL
MPQETRRHRYVLLDGLRGVAAFGVMAFHLWVNPNIFAGFNIFVDFFFVLSGFVLAPQLLSGARNSKKIFVLNRVLRFWPMLIPVFIVVISCERVPILHEHVHGVVYSPLDYLGAFFLLQVFIGAVVPVVGPLWSLSAEFFVNLLATRLLPRGSRIFYVVFAGFLVEVLGLYVNQRYKLGWGVIEYLIAAGRVIVGFYLGLFLRQRSDAHHRATSKSKLIFYCGLFLICFWLFYYSDWLVLCAAPIFYLLISEVSHVDEAVLPKSLLKICSYLGRVSYGIYVWHVPVGRIDPSAFVVKHALTFLPRFAIQTFDVVFTTVVVIFATEVSIRLFEIPIRRWGRRRVAALVS